MPPPTRHVDALVAFQSSPRQTRQSVRDSVVIKLFESVCSSSSRLQLHTHTNTQSSVYTSVECLTGTGNRGGRGGAGIVPLVLPVDAYQLVASVSLA